MALLSVGEPVSAALHLLRLEVLLNVTNYDTSGEGEFFVPVVKVGRLRRIQKYWVQCATPPLEPTTFNCKL